MSPIINFLSKYPIYTHFECKTPKNIAFHGLNRRFMSTLYENYCSLVQINGNIAIDRLMNRSGSWDMFDNVLAL